MKLRRIVTLLAVALVLGTMLALSAAAEIVGGNGKFVNDDGSDITDYETAAVTYAPYVLAAGKTPAMAAINDASYIALNEGNNTALAGLYSVKENGGAAKVVYVRGLVADRKAIASKGVDVSNNWTGNPWKVGHISSIGYVGSISYDSNGKYTKFTPTGDHYGKVDDYPKIAFNTAYDVANDTDTVKNSDPALYLYKGEITWTDYVNAVAKYSYKYALKSTEIVPANEFTSLTYDIEKTSGATIDLGSANTKLCVLVYDVKNNVFKTYEAIDDAITASVYKEFCSRSDAETRITRHTVTAADLLCGKDKLSDIGDGWYILGYEVFPCVNVDVKALSINRNIDSKVLVDGYNGKSALNKFALTIYQSEYDLASNILPKDISYDEFTKTISGLAGGLDYYITTYDATGIDYANAVPLTVDLDGTAIVPTTYKGLIAVFAKGDDYHSDSKPFIFYTYTADAGKFNVINPTYVIGKSTAGTDLLVPGSYRLPNISAVGLDYNINSSTSGPFFDLFGTSYTKASGLVTITSHYNENLFDYAGIYYGFTSTQSLPMNHFKGMTLPDNVYLVQGESSSEKVRETGEENYQTIANVKKLNGDMTGHLVLYYVTEDGTMGTYTVRGDTLTCRSAADSGFSKYSFIPTNEDLNNFKALGDAYIIGYALLPYNERHYDSGKQHLFNQYYTTGGNVYLKINTHKATNKAYCDGFDVSSEYVVSEIPDHISNVKGAFTSSIQNDTNYYQYAPVTVGGSTELSVTIGAYNATPFQLSDTEANSGFCGLYVLRRTNKDATIVSEASNIVYFGGTDEEKKQLGTINPDVTTQVKFEKSYEWIAGTWSGADLIWTNSGNTNDGNRFLFRDEFMAFSFDDAQKMWLYQNTSDYVTKLIADEKEMAAEKIAYFTNPDNSSSLTDAEKKLTAEQYVYWNGKTTRGSYDEDLLDAAVAKHYASYPKSGTPEFLATNADYLSFMETALAPYKDRHIQYLMTQDEIIPARDLVSMKMMTYREQGAINIGAFKSRLVVYVLQGDTIVPVEFVDEKTYSTVSRQDHEYDLSEKLANMDGYVVALRYYPWSEIDISTVVSKVNLLLTNSRDYRFSRTTPGSGYYMDGYRIKERIAAPVAELVEGGDAITVADPNAEYEYLYKAVGDAEWKALDEENIGIFDKAGTKYVVKIADGKYCYESPESNEVTSHGFVATGTSLLLSGDIGIKTTFDVSDAAAFEDLKFFDTATGNEVEVVKDANSVTIYVPAKDKTKNFEYRYGNNVIRSVSTVEKYVDEFDSENTTATALVNALDNYTDYSAIYFGVDGVTADGPFLNDLTSVESSYEYVGPSANITDVEYLGAALILEGKTSIRHYFDVDLDVNYTVKIGEEVKATGQLIYDDKNECYYADIADISANNYDVQYTIQVGDSTVTYSVLNYLVNSVKKDKTELVNLVKAMYDYYEAAKAYAESLIQPAE